MFKLELPNTVSVQPVLHPNGGFILAISAEDLAVPAEIEIAGEAFQAKTEFHVTLVSGQYHNLKKHFMNAERLGEAAAVARAHAVIAECMQGIDFDVQLKPEPRLVQAENNAATIIVMCDVEGAAEFYSRLWTALNVMHEYPPHHITVYTRANEQSRDGIPVATQKTMQTTTTLVPDITVQIV